ncbi:MAG: PfkB family carbohydrate kinase [Micromonosporaceae bacterium]
MAMGAERRSRRTRPRASRDDPPDGGVTHGGQAGLRDCAPAPVVEAVDTTGAGDAFLGALAARLRSGDKLAEAVGAAGRARPSPAKSRQQRR